MGVRETLNQQKYLAVGATVVVIIAAIVFIIRDAMSGGRPAIPTQSFYTVDDGATFFPDDNTLVPPFVYGGKQAVRAYVYSCGGKEFTGYLQRYSVEAKQQIEAAHGVSVGAVMAAGTEVKAPLTGDAGWVNAATGAAAKVYAVHCPGGSSDVPQPLMP